MTAQTLTAYILALDPAIADPATCVLPPGSEQRAEVEIRSVISVKLITLGGNSHTSILTKRAWNHLAIAISLRQLFEQLTHTLALRG